MLRPDAYRKLDTFAAPARDTAGIGRTLAGVILTFVAGLAIFQIGFALVSNVAGPDVMQALVERTTLAPDSAFATLYMLFTFGFFGIGLVLVVRALHRRAPATLIGPIPQAVRDFIRVALPVGGLFLLLTVLLPRDFEIARNEAMTRSAWIALLPLSLAGILVQSGTEEVVFRGYLQQQLAARFPRWPLWMIVPSALFAWAHFSPETAGSNAPLYVLWAFAFGVAAADLTARTGSVGAAVGFHVANNAVSLLVISTTGPSSGLALWLLPITPDDPRIAASILPELMYLLCGWLVARLALRV